MLFAEGAAHWSSVRLGGTGILAELDHTSRSLPNHGRRESVDDELSVLVRLDYLRICSGCGCATFMGKVIAPHNEVAIRTPRIAAMRYQVPPCGGIKAILKLGPEPVFA